MKGVPQALIPCVTTLTVFAATVLTVSCSGGDTATDPSEIALAVDAQPITDGRTTHRPAVPGVRGLVTAGHPLASMAGMRILMQGGTAADAAPSGAASSAAPSPASTAQRTASSSAASPTIRTTCSP